MTQANLEQPESALPPMTQSLLNSALAPVSENLNELKINLTKFLPLESKSSIEIAEHVFSGNGKFIRPALFFLSSKLCQYNGEHLIPISAVCEYVHTASLLHDDVVDNSELRRNKPTANKIWGDQAAVLVGDLIYSRASELMAATGQMDLVSTFARAIRKMSEGELLQLENVYNFYFTEQKYLTLLTCKTGVLIGASCRAGGILANTSEQTRDALEMFGQNIGVAFQLIDDALDYIGNRELFGKPTQSDLLEGKVTLPVILLQNLATESEKSMLAETISQKEITVEDVKKVSKLIEKYKTATLTLDRARTYTDSALELLHKNFPKSTERDQLESLAKSLLFRLS